MVVLSRVVHWFPVGVVGFDVGGVVDARGIRRCVGFKSHPTVTILWIS